MILLTRWCLLVVSEVQGRFLQETYRLADQKFGGGKRRVGVLEGHFPSGVHPPWEFGKLPTSEVNEGLWRGKN